MMDFRTLATGASALLVIWALLSRRRSSGKAPVVSYWIPWIGSAIDIGKDPDAFFRRATKTYGPVFTVNAFGRKVTYVTSPALISEVYRNPQKFYFQNIRLGMGAKVFKMDYEFSFSSFMQHKYLPAHHRYLSQQEIKPILKNYAKHAYEAIMESRDKFAGASTPLIPFIIPVAYKANAYAFFGRSFPAEESYEPFKSFDSVFHLKLAGIPEIFLQKSVRDWYKVHQLIKDYLKTPHEDAIALVHILEQDAEALGYTDQDIASSLSTDLWALQANAIWAVYWIIVLQIQRPEGLAPLIKEVDEARKTWIASHPGVKFEEHIDEFSAEATMPSLSANIQETLRYASFSMSMRDVQEPLEFAGYQFDKGEQVLCITRTIHLDEEIHKDAQNFIPDRYLMNKKFVKDGKPVPNHSMPFGGGVSQCEGRHFALAELKILVLIMLLYLDIEVDTKSGKTPTFDMQRIGTGILQPKGDLDVIIGERN